ncbi:MAG: flagellar FlbD family protein [Lachnospiraceae bacterium]|jgi:flagellar protein FlbD|nr:flagellar FlbD family protein [Lachnospiraceae bacterium]MCI9282522.1 flagellar FlbD family protein [Lachnospiraceae bacterium]
MVRVVRLNGEELYLNLLQIESMESIPETKVKMMNGDYFLVKDSADSILNQIRAFIKSCMVYDGESE